MSEPETDRTVRTLEEGLASHGTVTVKPMFGGRGVFVDGTMTAIVDREGWGYVRGDDESAPGLEASGAQRHGRMPYWRVPDEVWNDDDRLAEWLALADRTARRHAD